MRKSSFGGRRVSQPLRMDPDDMRASGSRRPPDGRRGSAIPQPGFALKGRRSSSENRNRMSSLPPMKRSRSQVNMKLQTPTISLTTPMRETNILKFGSAQSQRSPFSDGGHSSRKSTYSGTSKPNVVVKDTRPLTDKGYQQQEMQKINNFLSTFADGQSLAPKGINLKQLTTKLFVDIVNHLLGFFDSKICINMTNYVSEIPLTMKRWGYPGNLNTSWLKTVNTQHAFPHVLGLLSWLVTMASAMMRTEMDVVLQEALQCYDDDDGIDEAFPYGNAVLYMDHLFTQYGLWSKNDHAAEEKEENRFIADLCNRNGVGQEELRGMEEDVRNLEAQLNDPKEIAEMEAAVEEEKKYNACLKDYNLILDYKNRMDEHLNTAETELEETRMNIRAEEEALHVLQNKIMDLRELLKRQVMSAQERDELLKQCNEIASSIRENEEYISVVSNQIYADDLEMAKKNANLKKKTQAYNKIIVTESCWLPELKALKDDTNILHHGAEDELAQKDAYASQFKSELEKKLADLNSQIKQLKSELLQVEERKMTAVHEQQQCQDKVKHISENLNAIMLRSSEEASEMKKTIDSLKEENESRANCGTLEEQKAKLQQLYFKRDNGKILIEQNKQKALVFFQKSAAITQGVIDSVTRAEAEYVRKRNDLVQKAKERIQKYSSEVNQIDE
ncbi:kinetochore protein NDC80 homolog [Thrips palmi]|uniref:Kinetochore protein NDC80 n=1 Tax=Thrips palmi TaxID=161013 RepID=A0A6P9A9L2_THRPL|nr:kinetochore protein NDC80 homolog [Thrips palmi]